MEVRSTGIRWIRILTATLATVCVSIPLDGQQSSPASVCDRDPSNAIVFVGTLMESKATADQGAHRSLKFQVTEILQGDLSQEVSLLRENQRCDDTTTNPVIGGSFLVRTHILTNALEPLRQCDQMRLVDRAQEELMYFRRAQKGDTPTDVLFEARSEPDGFPWNASPLPGTKVHVSNGERQWDFVADQNGSYRAAFDPGHYALAIKFPAGYEPDPSGQCGVPELTAVENRCTLVALCAGPTASITAPLVDVDGSHFNASSNVQLSLVTAEGQEFVRSVWPDEEGNLIVDRLPPGKYILGLNTYLPATSDSSYPPIYYPGVSHRAEAEAITLGPGERKVLPEMRVKKGAPCDIPVQVFDEAGQPSPSAQLALFYRDYPHYWVDHDTDANGKGAVYAVFPGPVLLKALKPNEDQSVIESEPVEVDNCPAEPVQLKLLHPVTDSQESGGKLSLNPNGAATHPEEPREPEAIQHLQAYLRHQYLGEALVNQGDLTGAMKEFRAALSLEPNFVPAHVRLGYALGDSGDYDGEVTEEREALRLNPKDDGAHVGLGFALGSNGDFAGAEAEAREALRLNPNNDQAHANLAWGFWQKGDLDAAIHEERLALGLNPDNAMARDGLGNALGTKGDPEGAIDVFREALNRNPNDDVAHTGMGSALNVLQKWQESERENRTALRINPANKDAHANLATALASQGDINEALPELREALREEPDNPLWRFNLGVLLERKGDWDGAIPEFQWSLRIKPQNAQALAGLGTAFLSQNNPQAAIPILRAATHLEPNSESAHTSLAIALGLVGEWDGAVAERRELVRINPDNLDARVNLGDTIGRSGDWDGDVAAQRGVLLLSPNNSNAHTSLAWALGQKGAWDADIAEEHEALRLDPNQPNVHGDLGYALAHKGSLNRALEECHEALRLNPQSDDGHFCLGAVAEAKGNFQEALQEYHNAIEINPLEPEYRRAYERLTQLQSQ